MTATASSVAAQMRSLARRHLDSDAYLREMAALADLEGREPGASGKTSPTQADYWTRVERLLALRRRVAVLERRVRKLEARK
ncbi:MAG: hypothetical protein J0H34_00670 [Rhizobiales bacterium]|nr:hypothetical protein [Hyphomicrobiales bacterium]